jgi:hypothetical protein
MVVRPDASAMIIEAFSRVHASIFLIRPALSDPVSPTARLGLMVTGTAYSTLHTTANPLGRVSRTTCDGVESVWDRRRPQGPEAGGEGGDWLLRL